MKRFYWSMAALMFAVAWLSLFLGHSLEQGLMALATGLSFQLLLQTP